MKCNTCGNDFVRGIKFKTLSRTIVD